MIIGTFLNSYTWTSETNIYPFFQGADNSNTEYYNNSMDFIMDNAPGPTVHEGLYISHSNRTVIDSYLKENGFIDRR